MIAFPRVNYTLSFIGDTGANLEIEKNHGTIDDHFAHMLKIHSDAIADHGLHLPQTPFRLVGMPHKIAGFKKLAHNYLRRGPVSDPTIDALVSSRICHDLISPVGAIGNGVELLEELATSMPEIALIADSVNSAKAKLMFFRICFGQSSVGAILGTREMESAARAMFETNRLSMEWAVTTSEVERDMGKLLFLLLLATETALPLGGVIRVTQDADGWQIAAEGTRIQMVEAWDLLAGGAAETVTPAQVQFLLASRIAQDLGRSVAVSSDEMALKISL